MEQEHTQQLVYEKGPQEKTKAVYGHERSGRKPTKVFRHGACSACIFFNPVQRDGQSVEMPSISFAKLYTKRGLLKSTSSLRPEDLAAAVIVLGQAHEWLRQLEEEEAEVMRHA